MVVRGSGASRKSHTKSRKGCRTCKRRHIRCDEMVPQWYVLKVSSSTLKPDSRSQNCTKHQVRCDYMDDPSITSHSETTSPEPAKVKITPRSENNILNWQQTSSFSYDSLGVCPLPDTDALQPSELRFIHSLISISNDLSTAGVSDLTLWTSSIPKYFMLIPF